MENHPIPQDITGFQFKLIGQMTIKEFAYLAGGVILGWIIFSLPIIGLIKIPFAAFLVLLGASLAFVPIEGRPLDVMLLNFIRAIFNPTQFIYKKTGGHLWFSFPPKKTASLNNKSDNSREKLKVFLQALPKAKNKLDEKEMNFFNSVSPSGGQGIPRIISMQDSQIPPKEEVKKTFPQSEETDDYLKRKAMIIEKALETAKLQESSVPSPSGQSSGIHKRVLDLEKQLADILFQKEQLTQQLISLQKKLTSEQQNVYTPTTATIKPETQNVRKIPKGMGKSLGLPITPDVANLITGIIKDPRGNPLPNILVEVKDKEGNPVRAFKTNGLGQFASATPLSNGTYNIEFEDPKALNKFDTIEFTANSEIILPIEVISVDTREELRRSLFS